jgi:hypothetical protein
MLYYVKIKFNTAAIRTQFYRELPILQNDGSRKNALAQIWQFAVKKRPQVLADKTLVIQT